MSAQSTLQAATLVPLSGTFELDAPHTRIGFAARHAMVAKVRGSFDEFSGTALLDLTDPESSRATVTIKSASINTRNPQRDAHLRSDDFLAADAYPDITFVSTRARQVSGDEYELVGDLTIKGITKEVEIPFTYQGCVRDPYGNLRVGFEGAVAINRKDFGVTWNAALETGGVLVGETVVLELEVSAVRVDHPD
jgi:polyisoprenoid-binding protein YceI